MARAIVTLKIMPDSPESDLESIKEEALERIREKYGDSEFKAYEEPVAFGLKALKIIFVIDEKLGSTDEVEGKIKEIDGVNSVECVDVRRAIG